MRIRWPATARERSIIFEGILLLLCTPFLLFPSRFIIGTASAFLMIALLEALPPLFKWRPVPNATPIDSLLLLSLLLLIISIIVTADPSLTLNKASGVILGIGYWRYISRSAKKWPHWQLALTLFGLFGFGFTGLGVLSANWLAKTTLLSNITAALPSFTISLPGLGDGAAHPNQVAGTLLFYIPLLWSMLLGRWQTFRPWQRILVATLALAATAVLILTQSRSGWLAGVSSLYILIFLWTIVLPANSKFKHPLTITTAMLTVFGIVAVILIGPDRIASLWQDPAQETLVGSVRSLGFRQEVWQWTVVMLQDFPFTGIGLGSFQHVIRRLYPIAVTPTFTITHAHNIFLQTAVDFGLIGLINYLALMGVFLAMLWKTARNNLAARPYALGFAATLLAYHIYGLGDVLDSKTNLVIWIMYGLITALYQIGRMPKSPTHT